MFGEPQTTIGMILGDIAFILGALAMTGTLTRVSNYFLKKKFSLKKAAIISFIIIAILVVLLNYMTIGYQFGLRRAFIIFIPCLILWLIRDIKKAKRSA